MPARDAHPRRPGEDHVESEEEEQQAAGDPDSRQPDVEGLEQHVTSQDEQEEYEGAKLRAPCGRLALLLLWKPRVSAAKMGARPSGSTTTSSVTKALNANSIGRNSTSQRRTCVGDDTPLAPQRPRPAHGLLPDPASLRLVATAQVL